MLDRIVGAWKKATWRSVQYGVFDLKDGSTVLVSMPMVEKLPRFQAAQGEVSYGRPYPWGDWNKGLPNEVYDIQPGSRKRGWEIRELAVTKFIRY